LSGSRLLALLSQRLARQDFSALLDLSAHGDTALAGVVQFVLGVNELLDDRRQADIALTDDVVFVEYLEVARATLGQKQRHNHLVLLVNLQRTGVGLQRGNAVIARSLGIVLHFQPRDL